ncbi:MAG: alpha/beta hydrolase-fold protein [Phycisphaerales bacterium]|nr:alpha/beta hydrolase-fold protein [Phycisphaerales bacterium]
MPRLLLIFMMCSLASAATHADWPGLVPPDEVPVYAPSDYDPEEPAPLVIFLHGYSPLTTAWYDILLPLQEDANANGYIFAKPDGNQDGIGEFYWNATDACCDMFGNEPDHVGYLMALVESIQSNYNIDPRRIHMIGHSNGGFMCHRMACEHSDTFASVVSISGAMWYDQSICQPAEPIHVLQIHGTLDPIIFWLGGLIGLTPYPGVNTTIEYWATHNGCSTEATLADTFDLDWLVLFSETRRWIYEGCDDATAGSAELWEIFAGLHFPSFTDEGISQLFTYLDTHSKPEVACDSDVNGDLQIDVQDILLVINDWETAADETDVNDDGIVNVIDLLIVIDGWGPCE